MKIRITDTNEIKTVSLRIWRGGWNSGFEPDCSSDILDGGNIDHNEDGECIMTAAEYTEFCAWWDDEVSAANTGRDGDGLTGLDDDEIDNGDEWIFDHD